MAWIVKNNGKIVYLKDDVEVFEIEPEHLANKYKVKEFTNNPEMVDIYLHNQNAPSNPRAKKP